MEPPRFSSISLSLSLSSLLLLLLPFLTRATPFRHSLKQLEGSKNGDKREGIQKVMQYLQRYGYLKNYVSPEYSDNEDFDDLLESSLKTFQNFHHLPPTGILDDPTAALMSRPRCGYPDHHPDDTPSTLKWPADQMHIHYRVSPGSLPEQPITNGFNAWAAVSNFTFENVREEIHAKLRITVKRIDGEGGVLADFNPSLIGPYVVLDEDENEQH